MLRVKPFHIDEQNLEWSVEYPTKKDLYWFYGKIDINYDKNNDLYLIQVIPASNGTLYATDGYFLSKSSIIGIWMPVIKPNIPEVYED